MYAYNFKTSFAGVDHRKIFVVMPLAKEYNNIYNTLIKDAVDEANNLRNITNEEDKLFCLRADDDITTKTGWENVLENLMTAQIVLGVLTDNNHNVFYELGIAHSTQPITRQLLIADQEYTPAFDTKDLIFYEYDDSDWANSSKELAKWIIEVLKSYNIENEKIIKKARMSLGPYAFEVIMKMGKFSHFVIHSDKEEWKKEFEKDIGEGSFERFAFGIQSLCSSGLLGLNTISSTKKDHVNVEFSYYWTSLGNSVLYMMKLIPPDELYKRRRELPDFFEG